MGEATLNEELKNFLWFYPNLTVSYVRLCRISSQTATAFLLPKGLLEGRRALSLHCEIKAKLGALYLIYEPAFE
jgi:hypothetical protein